MDDLLRIGLSNAVAATLLAVVALAVGRIARRPALTHALWLLVLIKLITPPLRVIEFDWPRAPEKVALSSPEVALVLPADADLAGLPEPDEPVRAEPEEIAELPAIPADDLAWADPAESQTLAPISALHPAVGWKWLVGAAWLAGSVAWLLLAGWRTWRCHAVLRHAQPAPRTLRAEARRLARRVGLWQCPGVWLVPGRVSPMLWAIGSEPRLYLPAALLPHLNDDQRAALLIHELAHLRRGDHWVRALEILTTCLYWWHPVLWLARHELREAEEQCCDAWVVWTLPGSARSYALALVETLDFLSEARPALPAVASGMGRVSDLRRRLTMIMRGTTPRRLSWLGLSAVIGAAVLLLPLVPSLAQSQPPAPQERPSDDPRGRAEQQRAEAELAKAEADLAHARAQLQEAERRLQEMRGRIRQREPRDGETRGRREGNERRRMTVIIRDENGRDIRRIEVQPGQEIRVPGGPDAAPKPDRPGAGPGGQPPAAGERPGRFSPPQGIKPDPAPRGGPMMPPGAGGVMQGPGLGPPGMQPGAGIGRSPDHPGGPDQERRLQDLERRLNDMMRVLEQMRDEMRQRGRERRSEEPRPEPERNPRPARREVRDPEVIKRVEPQPPDVPRFILPTPVPPAEPAPVVPPRRVEPPAEPAPEVPSAPPQNPPKPPPSAR